MIEQYFKEFKDISIYGARYKMYKIISLIRILNYSNIKIKNIIVSDLKGNPTEVDGIPVQVVDDINTSTAEKTLLAIPRNEINCVIDKLNRFNTDIIIIPDEIIDIYVTKEYMFNDVKESIDGFMKEFSPDTTPEYNIPVNDDLIYAWTCWWQGIDNAPNIVKVCVNSHRKNLPKNVKYTIITEQNYKNYIDIPNYIIEKVNKGFITITTLSDIIRSCLLFKYGGMWIDSTVLIHKPLEYNIFNFNIMSCTFPPSDKSSYSGFSLWFMGGKSGYVLFRFLMEAFFYYYKNNDRIKYYLTIDYLIENAKTCFPIIKYDFDCIPPNNTNAGLLFFHLDEKYDEIKFQEYTKDTEIQKLSWKLSDRSYLSDKLYNPNSIYSKIIDLYL